MRTMTRTILAALAASVLSVQAGAQSVAALAESCSDAVAGTETFRAAYCVGIVSGAAMVMRLNCSAAEQGFIDPANIGGLAAANLPSAGDGVQAFVDWAAANPDQGALDGRLGVVLALRDSFTC